MRSRRTLRWASGSTSSTGADAGSMRWARSSSRGRDWARQASQRRAPSSRGGAAAAAVAADWMAVAPRSNCATSRSTSAAPSASEPTTSNQRARCSAGVGLATSRRTDGRSRPARGSRVVTRTGTRRRSTSSVARSEPPAGSGSQATSKALAVSVASRSHSRQNHSRSEPEGTAVALRRWRARPRSRQTAAAISTLPPRSGPQSWSTGVGGRDHRLTAVATTCWWDGGSADSEATGST